MSDAHMIRVNPPRQGRMQRIAVAAAAATTALTAEVLGMGWVRVRARGTNVQFYFTRNGADACTIDSVTVATMGWSLMNGQAEDFYITNDTHIAWDAEGAGFIDIVRAGEERTGTR